MEPRNQMAVCQKSYAVTKNIFFPQYTSYHVHVAVIGIVPSRDLAGKKMRTSSENFQKGQITLCFFSPVPQCTLQSPSSLDSA